MVVSRFGRWALLATSCLAATTTSYWSYSQDGQQPAAKSSGEDADKPVDDLDQLLDLKIEDLGRVQAVAPAFDVEVTSVTKTKSTIGKSPAAVYVVTQEMIRRSGVTTIPDALRMVPGLNVAQNSASRFAVSSRGFNGVFANKLLVMIDGRSIYTPAFGGVFWDVEDLILQDIERIEVIRGPGATVWGENAVNGVINIITKTAKETQGGLATAGGGNWDRNIMQFRHGGQVKDDVYYRVFGKYRDHESGWGSHDDWRQGRIGMRVDWLPEDGPDSITFIAQLYDGQVGRVIRNEPLATPPFIQNRITDEEPNGANILARWTHKLDDDGSWTLQAYYDRVRRIDGVLAYSMNVWDVDFQHDFKPLDDHHITWGIGNRFYVDNITHINPVAVSFSDRSIEFNRTGAFLQDEISLTDEMNLILGTKISYNDFSHFEYQPGARLNISLDDRHVVWGAVSRAVRLPTRIDNNIQLRQFAAPPFVYTQINGNPRMEAEDLLSFELGYRVQQSKTFSWDVSTFFNKYEDLSSVLPIGPMAGLPPTIPVQFANNGSGEAYGFELHGQADVTDNWHLNAWYALLRLDINGTGSDRSTETSSPRNTVFLMSTWDLTDKVEVDVIGRYVDQLASQNVPAYINMDVRLGYRPNEKWYLWLAGQNLLDSHHSEFNEGNGFISSSEVRRGVYGQVEYRY